jgi:hypothetical protein
MRRIWFALFVAACGNSSDQPGPGDPGVDGGGSNQPDGSSGACRQAPPADGVRRVVISHPFDASGGKSNQWEVLDLSATGELSRPNRMFTMGRQSVGEIAFTSDGKVGFVAQQEDGSVGIFKLDGEGVPTVLHANYKDGGFYANRVVVSPDNRIFVLDRQWRNNGGGIYELSIDCNDQVTTVGKIVEAKLPGALLFTESGEWIVAAHDIGPSTAGNDVHVVQGPSTIMAGANAFSDDMQIVGGATLTTDGAVLVGDVNSYSTMQRRIAVTPMTGTQLGTPYMISNVEDPLALISHPFADKVLVVSGFGDAMFQLAKGTNNMWGLTGELTYAGGKPLLPGGAVMIERGSLRGLVLIAENEGVRRVEMYGNGNIVDKGNYSLGTGLTNSPGAIGVTP